MSEEKKFTDEATIDSLKEMAIKFLKDTYVNRVLVNAINLIHRLQSENERLKDEKEEIRLFNLSLQNGKIDMQIESEIAKSFYNSIIQVFEQNGANNFFTTTIDIEGKNGRYAFTIEKVGGQTVAEKLAEQKAEIERLTERHLKLMDEHDEYGNLAVERLIEIEELKAKNAELQKQVEKLTEERDKYQEKWQTSYMNELNLQKQVDELKARDMSEMRDLFNTETDRLIEKAHQQAVKDTAKEICDDLRNIFIEQSSYGSDANQHIGYYDYEVKIGLVIEQIEEYAKENYDIEYGVEVE